MTASFELDGFEPMSRLGGGGFGDVWLARQTNVDRQVAIKVGHAPIQDETIRLRFDRECKALGRLSGHPNIVDVYTAGSLDDGRPYLVLEYIGGGTLWQRLKKSAIPEKELRALAQQLAAALNEAHSSGVLHRDLKPENILIRATGEAVLGDFGIARLQDGVNTTSAAITASVAYAAPEILSGKRATVASDLYGIGVCLLAAVHRSVPFVKKNDESIHPIINRVMTEAHPDVRRHGVSDEFASIVDSLLSKDAAERPVSAADLLDQLSALPPVVETVTDTDLGDDVVVADGTQVVAPTRPTPPVEPHHPLRSINPAEPQPIEAETKSSSGIISGDIDRPGRVQPTPSQSAAITGVGGGSRSIAMLPDSGGEFEPPPGPGRSDVMLFAAAYVATLLIGGLALYFLVQSQTDDQSAGSTETNAAVGAVPLTDAEGRIDVAGVDTSAPAGPEITEPAPLPDLPLVADDTSFGGLGRTTDQAPGPAAQTLCNNSPAIEGLNDWSGNVISDAFGNIVLHQVLSRFGTSSQAETYLDSYLDTNDCASWTVEASEGDQLITYTAEQAVPADYGDNSYRIAIVGQVDDRPVINGEVLLVRTSTDVLVLSLSADSPDQLDELASLADLAIERLSDQG
jgi:serine/threonine protein kinase